MHMFMPHLPLSLPTAIMDSGPTLCDGEFGVCGPNATCVRVDGGYQCVCDAGFVDSGDDCFSE